MTFTRASLGGGSIRSLRGAGGAVLCAVLLADAIGVLASRSAAQCQSYDPTFQNGSLHGYHLLDGYTFDMIVHDDGSGPKIYAGGQMAPVPVTGRNLAIWNGTSWWSPLYVGSIYDVVYAVEFFDRGFGPELYAGGSFSALGSYNLIRWDGGFNMSLVPAPLGIPPFHYVLDLKTYDDGTGPSLYVGGNWTGVYGQSFLLRWDGFGSYPVGAGVNGTVLAMEVWDDGTGSKLYVGGTFTLAGGIPVVGLASWDGTSWAAVGPTNLSPGVSKLAVGDLGRGLELFVARGADIERFHGQTWTSLGQVNGQVWGLVAFDDGTGPALFAGGGFTQIGGVSANRLAKWDGQSWHSLGSGADSTVYSMVAYTDPAGPRLYFGGGFSQVGAIYSDYLGAWRGCSQPIELMCPADGTLVNCPCGNLGATDNGCGNSVSSAGASLRASGTPALNDVQFTLMNVPQASLTLLVQGQGSRTDNLPFGDGLLCLDGRLVRMWTRTATSGSVLVPDTGDPSVLARSAARGDPIGAGDVRYYQTYYRDVSATYCPAPSGGTFNVSNGVRIVW
ncbi:MAG: hypothetical protein HZA53_08400 [Planctomycetes bacterium]|nr:hypothetical protein [Planctomycetota bacterium]